jgi:hypothetical protein
MRPLYRLAVVACALALVLMGWSLLAGWQTERAESPQNLPRPTLASARGDTHGELIGQPRKGHAVTSHLFPRDLQVLPMRASVSLWAALTAVFVFAAARQIRRRPLPG